MTEIARALAIRPQPGLQGSGAVPEEAGMAVRGSLSGAIWASA